jgi:hypothetical protein
LIVRELESTEVKVIFESREQPIPVERYESLERKLDEIRWMLASLDWMEIGISQSMVMLKSQISTTALVTWIAVSLDEY